MLHVLLFLLATGFNGTWQGKTNDLPSVELNVRQDGARITGTIGFYFQTRSEGGTWRAGPKTDVELLSPKLEGKVLSFETIHHKGHNSSERGPTNRYKVEFLSDTEARMHMYAGGEAEKDDGPGLKLTRRE